jgi:hypothetical protein
MIEMENWEYYEYIVKRLRLYALNSLRHVKG